MKTPAVVRTTAPSVASAARDIGVDLRRRRDPERARGTQNYFKQEIVALGIPAPVLRALIRDRVRPWRGEWTPQQAIHLCDRLLREPELEVRGAGLLALEVFGKWLPLEVLEPAERWLGRRLDNWALVDSCCGMILSPLLARFPELERRLIRWSGAKSLWLRRAALVTLVPAARHGQHLDTVYRLAAAHFADPEDLMHKATGWLLREAGKTDSERLRRFLRQHGPAVPRTALRYAIERFPTADRAALLMSTRAEAGTRRPRPGKSRTTDGALP